MLRSWARGDYFRVGGANEINKNRIHDWLCGFSILLSILGTTLLVGSGTPTYASGVDQRIRFETGAVCVRQRGLIAPHHDATVFVVAARKGQHMIVNLAPRAKRLEFANVGVVISPSGKQEGGKGGIVFDRVLVESGEYRIRVARNLMATHGGAAGFVLEVIIY